MFSGSTAYAAIGLDTLKRQQEHFDRVMFGKEPQVSEKTAQFMKHGTENEINALATLVGKVVPSLYPNLCFVEEGFYEMTTENQPFFIVSPDGSLRSSPLGDIKCMLEFKCPFPGKKFTTDVFYELPVRYVPQLLAEMNIGDAPEMLLLCWSDESSTLFRVLFDESLWLDILTACGNIYCIDKPRRPARLDPNLPQLKEKLKNFITKNTEFLMEFTSLKAIPCHHTIDTSIGQSSHYNAHYGKQCYPLVSKPIECLLTLCYKALNAINDAHERTKNMCTEVLVWVVSDIYRHYKPEKVHALPVSYALKGYSLSVEVFRKMHTQVLKYLHDHSMYVPVSSYDGQWASLAVKNDTGEPLTVLQLQKHVFRSVMKLQKSAVLTEIEKHLLSLPSSSLPFEGNSVDQIKQSTDAGMNCLYLGQLTEDTKIFWQQTVVQDILRRCKALKKTTTDQISSDLGVEVQVNSQDYILNSLDERHPIDQDFLTVINSVNQQLEDRRIYQSSEFDELTGNELNPMTEDHDVDHNLDILYASPTDLVHEVEITSTIEINSPSGSSTESSEFHLNDDQKTLLHEALKSSSTPKIASKWHDIAVDTFKTKLENAETIYHNFTIAEMKIMLDPIIDNLKAKNVKVSKSWTKDLFSNLFSQLCGDGSKLTRGTLRHQKTNLKVSPSNVASACQQMTKLLSKRELNCVYAHIIWPSQLAQWKHKGPFKSGVLLQGLSSPLDWYSQPRYVPEISQYHFDILDPHHQITNMRYKVCKWGIPKAGISKEAWHQIAGSSHNRTGLSLPMVEDIVDRQSSSFALKTFSIEVEECLITNGYLNEGELCQLIRGFHEAVDQPGIPAIERIKKLLALRSWLLKDVDFSIFPPPGIFIKDISLVEYEGLLTSIERRIQLYSMVPGNNYNCRAISTLDSESFFSCFQDLHPAGSGILKPKEVPNALSAACDILSSKMDASRYFHFCIAC